MGGGKRQIINMQSCGTFQEFFFSSLEDIDMKNKINLLKIIQNKKIVFQNFNLFKHIVSAYAVKLD